MREALARPSIVGIAAALGVLVFAPPMSQGWQADDFWHQIFLRRDPRWAPAGLRSPLDLFTFYDGDPARTRWLVDNGGGAWWTDPHVRLAFWRPLTALTHLADHALFPGSPIAAHVHSLLWYGALVALVAALFRRVLGPTWIAGLAAVIYAVDHNHGLVACWIANRNAAIAGVLGVGSLLAHVRARETGSRALAASSAAALGAALLAGESGVAAIPWLVAWAATLDRGPWRARAAWLAPHAVVAGAWAIAWRAGGYGARGSDVYLDPIGRPGAYGLAVLERLPQILAADLGAPPPDLVVFAPRAAQLAMLAVTLAFLAWSAWVLAPLVREDRVARFFALGAVLSVVPSCATFASGRLLTLPGIGLVGLVAQATAAVLDRAAWVPVSGMARRAAVAFALVNGGGHLAISPLLAQANGRQAQILGTLIARWSDSLGDEGLERQRVVVVNAPDTAFLVYVSAGRSVLGRPVPRALLPIAPGSRDVEIERTDARTIVARLDRGWALEGMELLTASRTRRWSPGDHVDLTGVRVDVLDVTPEAQPARVAFRFDEPLESDGLRWTRWDGDGLVPFALPRVGERVTVAGQLLRPF